MIYSLFLKTKLLSELPDIIFVNIVTRDNDPDSFESTNKAFLYLQTKHPFIDKHRKEPDSYTILLMSSPISRTASVNVTEVRCSLTRELNIEYIRVTWNAAVISEDEKRGACDQRGLRS